jgi:antitoxin ParD1/3/4
MALHGDVGSTPAPRLSPFLVVHFWCIIAPYVKQEGKSMNRQSISLTTPNDEWLKAQVGTDKEYTSKSDVVNDLIRKARAEEQKIEAIRAKLIEAEQSGFFTPDREAMLAEFKIALRNE